MTVIAPRIVQIVVGPAGATGRLWDRSLYIKGKIERTSGSTPDKAEIELYNLAPVSVAYLERPKQVLQVRLGVGTPGTIFFGEIQQGGIKTKIAHPNQITTIKAVDGLRVMQDGYFTGSYPAGTTRSQIVADVLAQNAIPRGYVAPLPERTYEAPVMLSAPVNDVLDELYSGEAASWSLASGRFVLLLDSQPLPGNAPIISAATGMLGSPERTDKGVKTKWRGVGDVVPGGPFVLKSRLVSGTYKAAKISTMFDTELQWEDQITGTPVRMSSQPKQTPIDGTLRELLQLSTRAFGDKGGDLPAKVLTYDASTQTADVQPVVLVPDPVRGLKPAAIARHVQVRWPAGATWSIVGDLVAGDFGWLRVAGADISAWKMRGVELDPLAVPRSGSPSDVVFEPGSQPVSVPLASDAYKAGALVVKAASLLLGDSTATAFVALADLVDTVIGNITAGFDPHVHLDPVSGITSGPVEAAPPNNSIVLTPQASVAAAKVKAK